MQPFSLIVSVTPPDGLDPDWFVDELLTKDSVRGATARTPPADPESQLNVFLSVFATTPEEAGTRAIQLVQSLAPDRAVKILGGNVFGFGGHS